MRWLISVYGLSAAALACAAPGSVRYREVSPRPPRVAVPSAPVGWLTSPDRPRTAAIVGTTFDCRGVAIGGVRILLRGDSGQRTDSVSLSAPDGRFTLGPVAPGSVAIELHALFYDRRLLRLNLVPGRLDTIAVRFSAALFLELDCFGPGGYRPCPVRTAYTCTTDRA